MAAVCAYLRERQAAGQLLTPGAIQSDNASVYNAVHARLGGWPAVAQTAGVTITSRQRIGSRTRYSGRLPGQTLAERVRLRRASLGLTQLQLASRADLSLSEVEYIESGTRGDGGSMKVGTARRLAKALGVTLDGLF